MNAADQLKAAMRESIILTELQHTRVQLRLVSALLAGALIFAQLDPALLLLGGSGHSMLELVATLTTLGAFGVGLVFLLVAALLAPYLALQGGLFWLRRRAVVKLGCAALALAGVVWIFLAWRCAPLDFGAAAPWVFARNGAGALLFSLALALSLNAELLRKLEQRP